MPEIRPFRGLRPSREFAAKVASPPYDVLSSDEARAMVQSNPDSFLRVNKPEVDFEQGNSVYAREVYERGRENLVRLVKSGRLVQDSSESLYLYRLTWQKRSQTGLVCLASLEDYHAGKIKKHEHTRPEKVTDRADHIQTLRAQVGPVFSIFRSLPTVSQIFGRITTDSPEIAFTAEDSVGHQLWIINDETEIEALTEAFGQIDSFYIADGHHRSEAAAEVCRRCKSENSGHTGDESYNYFLNVIFPDNELRILPYNRVLKTSDAFDQSKLLEMVSERFEMTASDSAIKPEQPEAPHHFGLYHEGKWWQMKAREGSFEADHPAQSIDAEILYRNLLKPVFGIEDIRTDRRIGFVGGIRGVKELTRLVDRQEWNIAFSLFPVSVAQLLRVADSGEVMPPKSTWFEPKLRSGMVTYLLDELTKEALC